MSTTKSRIGNMLMVVFISVQFMANHVQAQDGGEAVLPEQDNTTNTTAVSEDLASPAPQPMKRERIKPLWISGLAAFGTFYITTAVVTTALSESAVRGQMLGYGLIPLFGPFIAVGNDNDDITVEGYEGALIFAGVAQILAAGVFTAGLIIKRDVPVEETALQRHKRLARPSFMVTPYATAHGGAGAMLTLRHL